MVLWSQAVEFRLRDATASQSGLSTTEVQVAGFEAVQAFQFTIAWDAAQFELVETDDYALANFDASNTGVFPGRGQLTVAWDSIHPEGADLADGATLLSLVLRGVGEDGVSSSIRFRDVPTPKLVVRDSGFVPFESLSGVLRIGTPPAIAGIVNFVMFEDIPSNPIKITLTDDATPPEDLLISFSSANESLISPEGIKLTGTGRERALTVVPRSHQFGITELGIRVEDGNGEVTEIFFTVSVHSLNDPPNPVDDYHQVTEDSDESTIAVLENDLIFPDLNEELSIRSVSAGSAGGQISHDQTKVYYRPVPDFYGREEFTYRVTDSGGATAEARVSVDVAAVNDSPTARDDRLEVLEDSSGNEILVLANDDSFPDRGEQLTVGLLSSGNQGGTLSLFQGTTVVYAPLPDFFGIEEFRYTVLDGNGGESGATVKITVHPVNDPPTAVDDEIDLNEDVESALIDVLQNDRIHPDEGETLALVSLSPPHSGGQVAIVAGQVRYVPLANYSGIDRFEYTITDGNGGLATGLVTVRLKEDQGDGPQARDDRFTVAEDSQELTLAVLEDNGNGWDFDPDGDELILVSVSETGSQGGRIRLDDSQRELIYRPAENFVGLEWFSYEVSDGQHTATGYVFVTILPGPNAAPSAKNDDFAVDEDSGEYQLFLLQENGQGADTDPDGDEIWIASFPAAGSQGGALRLAADRRSVFYRPAPEFHGIEIFAYSITDGKATASAMAFVRVNPVNDSPVVSELPDLEVFPLRGWIISFTVSDEETPAEELQVAITVADPALASVVSLKLEGEGSDRNASIVFGDAYTGLVPFEIVVTDPEGGQARASFSAFVREAVTGPDVLTIVRIAGELLEITWEGSGRLHVAESVTGPFRGVSGASSPFRFRAAERSRFYRVIP